MRRLLLAALTALLPGTALADSAVGGLSVGTSLVGSLLYLDQGPGADRKLGFNTTHFGISSGSLILNTTTLGSTALTIGGTTSSISGLTLSSPTIAGGALSGTFSGTPTLSGNLIFSGVPKFTGLSTGTQVTCWGRDSSNNLVESTGACGAAGSVPIGNVTGLGANVATFLATPTSSNFSTALVGALPVTSLGSGAADFSVLMDVAGVSTYKPVPDCQDTGGNHLNFTRSTFTWSCGTSGGAGAATQVDFVGPVTAGSANTYTIATPVPNTWTLTDGYIVRSRINTANTGASTLAVGGTAAKAIQTQSGPGLAALTGGELLTTGQQYEFTYNASADAYVWTNAIPGGLTVGATSGTVTKAQWAYNHTFVVTTAAQTITIPAGLGSNGSITIEAIGVSLTLQASGTDTINAGGAGGSITIPSGSLVLVLGDGTSPAHYNAASLGGSNAVSVTSLTPDLIVTPSPGVTAFTIARGGMTTVGNANCGTLTNSATANVGFNTVLTAARSCTLPALSTMTTGQEICFLDVGDGTSPAINGSNTVTINRASTDKIAGANSLVMTVGYAAVCLQAANSTSWAVRSNQNIGSQPATTQNFLTGIGSDGVFTRALVLDRSVSTGWIAGVDPNNAVIAVITQASTVSAIIGAVETPVGAAATVSVKKAPSGTACSAGTTLHSGSFNANGTAATNQTLTVTTSALAAGDRLCLQTTGGSNLTSGSGIGTLTVALSPS